MSIWTSADGRVTFDEEQHIYTIDGRVVPSVTQILSMLSPYQHTSVDQKWYMQRGRFVHEACQYDDEGTLNNDSLSPEIDPFLSAWRRFKTDARVKIMSMETIVAHFSLGYAGRYDRLMTLNDDDALWYLCDIKTGLGHGAQCERQTAAYAACVEMFPQRCCVHLTQDGQHRMYLHTRATAYQEFNSALTVWKILNEGNHE